MNISSQFSKYLFLGFFLGLGHFICFSQGNSYGVVVVENEGNMRIYDNWRFQANSVNKDLGIIGTERRFSKGYVSFMQNSNWSGASDNSFVDGYVRSYQSGSFLFPIGDNNMYRPVRIERASSSFPTEAAYFRADPTIGITSPFHGSYSPVLPADGPFNTAQMEEALYYVSPSEYWDINGSISTKITLTWDKNSAVSDMVSGSMKNLTIVGWDGSQWVRIQSQIDQTSILGGASDMNSGSITTLVSIAPSLYSVYTLAGIKSEFDGVFKFKNSQVVLYQGMTKHVTYPLNTNVSNPDNVITIQNSTAKYGTLDFESEYGYQYRANEDFIGVDEIVSVATIDNTRTGVTTYDTFRFEVIVRYLLPNTDVQLGNSKTADLGKAFKYDQGLNISHSLTASKGTTSNYYDGRFRYQGNFIGEEDEVQFVLNVDYLGIMSTTDTTKFSINKKSTSSIFNVESGEYEIQNYISPDDDGVNDYWSLPQALLDENVNLSIEVYDIEGNSVYKFNGIYKNNWKAENLVSGLYLYTIKSSSTDLNLKGLLRVDK